MPLDVTSMPLHDVLAAVAILVGILGVIVPVLPGTALVVGAVSVWALIDRSTAGWVALAVTWVLATLVVGWKVRIARRRLVGVGVPRHTMMAGAVGAVLGFFAVPVVGLVVGFVAGVVVSERMRTGSFAAARPTAVSAIKAAAETTGVELAGVILMALAWEIAATR